MKGPHLGMQDQGDYKAERVINTSKLAGAAVISKLAAVASRPQRVLHRGHFRG